MLDARIRTLIDPPLNRIGAGLAANGVSADALTWTGFGFGLGCIGFLAMESYGAALFCLLANRLFDGLDGAVARARGATDLGGFLDITLDFVIYAGVPFAMAFADPGANALAAAFLIFSFMGAGSSFLAFSAIAARRGLETAKRGRKSLYYLGGIMEGTETFVVLALCCVFPSDFAEIAVVAGALCWITTVSRIYAGYKAFGGPPAAPPTR